MNNSPDFLLDTEETERVIGEQRLSLLRSLASELSAAVTQKQLFDGVRRQLETCSRDLPFALLYVFDPGGEAAQLVCAHGVKEGDEIAPLKIETASPAGVWPAQAILTGRATIVSADLGDRFASFSHGPWPHPPKMAAIVPLAQQARGAPAGFLVVGINPYRPFNAAYRDFIELLAGQIAAALAVARACDQERQRTEAFAEINRARMAFFSNVSHEFRTPLTLVLSPLEDLVAKPEGALRPANRELAVLAYRNGRRLLKLVNTLLDFSRIDADRVDVSFEPVDLASFTAELASTFRSAMEKSGIELIVNAPPLREPVYVDREMWEKIVLNLMSNAFKFTLDGRIKVRVWEQPDRVLTEVADSGVGIPAEAIQHLFERFHQVHGVHGGTHEGSGIGLALVQELVKLHGGTIEVRSVPGQGSAFTVCIPKGLTHLPADHIRKASAPKLADAGASLRIEETLPWLPAWDDDGSSRPLDAGGLPPGSGGEHPTILLADDNADMLDYLERLLSQRYRVVAVADGQAALESARRDIPDLILTDVMMPRLDGFALSRELRSDRSLAAVPVIMLSARAGEEAPAEGLDAGADDYLIKPFTARELLARVAAPPWPGPVARPPSVRRNYGPRRPRFSRR